MAGRGADEGGRKPAGSGAQKGSVRARKLRSRGQKSRVERREAPALRKEARQDGKTRCAAWRSTPSAYRRGTEKGRRPRAVKKQGRRCTPAFARGFGGLIDNCIGKTSARQSRFPLPSWERVPSEARRVRGQNSRKIPHPHPARASLSLRAIHPLPQGERGKKKRREEYGAHRYAALQ
jgi:hypothetical protein